MGIHDAACLGFKRSLEHCAGLGCTSKFYGCRICWDVADSSSSATVLPTVQQARWDGKDAQAHALIALSVKRNITPHICSAKIAKQAWDTLAHLYAGRNEAKISYLRKELESKVMREEDDMNVFLAEIKDLKE